MGIAAWDQLLVNSTSRAAQQLRSRPTMESLALADGQLPSATDNKGAPKRKRLSQEERHLQILRTAAHIIAVKGFWGLSLQDISDEIGISEAALYHYIDSKEHLLNMVLTESYDTTEMTEFNALNASLVDGDGHHAYPPS